MKMVAGRAVLSEPLRGDRAEADNPCGGSRTRITVRPAPHRGTIRCRPRAPPAAASRALTPASMAGRASISCSFAAARSRRSQGNPNAPKGFPIPAKGKPSPMEGNPNFSQRNPNQFPSAKRAFSRGCGDLCALFPSRPHAAAVCGEADGLQTRMGRVLLDPPPLQDLLDDPPDALRAVNLL